MGARDHVSEGSVLEPVNDWAARAGAGTRARDDERERLVLVDPHRALRDALAGRLTRGRFCVVATVDSGQAALEAVRSLAPDLVMVEVDLPDMSGLALAARLAETKRRPRVLFYTGDSDVAVLRAALSAGAVGYALKDGGLEEVRWAVEQVASGRTYIDPRLEVVAQDPAPAGRGVLTGRELEVLAVVAEGLTCEEAAARLGIAKGTVREHLRRAMSKLRARNRTQAVAIALRAGLFEPPAGLERAAWVVALGAGQVDAPGLRAA